MHTSRCGPMDKAPAYGAGDSRFESVQWYSFDLVYHFVAIDNTTHLTGSANEIFVDMLCMNDCTHTHTHACTLKMDMPSLS